MSFRRLRLVEKGLLAILSPILFQGILLCLLISRGRSIQAQLLIAGVVFDVALIVLIFALFSRSVTRRVGLLIDNSQRLARGEPLTPQMSGGDEISDLDKSFHAMADQLTAAREAERQNHELMERRNAELLRANRTLDQQSEENEMFVYSVSHDLRSPLVNLQGFSKELGIVRQELRELLEGTPDATKIERARKLADSDIPESIHYIQTAVTRLSAIIDALLHLSRAGRVEYQPEVVELKDTIQRVVEAMQASIKQRGAKVTVQTLPVVWGDPTAVEQIFANLLGNAVNYLDPDRPGTVDVGVSEKIPEDVAGMQVFYVRDNGLGIDEAYLPKVFAAFQRLHPKSAPGEGIGLALVRRIVQRHGGKIWLESTKGIGSTFYVALPPKQSSPLVVAPRKESIRLSSPPPRV